MQAYITKNRHFPVNLLTCVLKMHLYNIKYKMIFQNSSIQWLYIILKFWNDAHDYNKLFKTSLRYALLYLCMQLVLLITWMRYRVISCFGGHAFSIQGVYVSDLQILMTQDIH